MKWLLLIFLLVCWHTSSIADDKISVSSPDGSIEFEFSLEGGSPFYLVEHDGRSVIAKSQLGVRIKGAPAIFAPEYTSVVATSRSHDETWETVWGANRLVRDHYNETTIELSGPAGRRIDVIVRVHDDGVGFRYRLPGAETLIVRDERTQFTITPTGTAWWIPQDFDSYEHIYRETAIDDVPAVNIPITMRLDMEDGDDLYLAIHEADLTGFPEMTLEPRADFVQDGMVFVDPRQFTAALVPYSKNDPVTKAIIETPFETPWRVITIGRTAGDLVESNLVLNLNDPCAICDDDASWIEASKYMGIWWEIHKGVSTWAPGPNLGATTENTKKYMDFAGEHGIPLLLVEGWNVGWEGGWGDMDFTTPQDEFDLHEVLRYGAERGVGFMAHMENGANVKGFEEQLPKAFALYDSLGIRAVKTGYVGAIDDYYHHGQPMVEHYQRVIELAAEHRIMVSAHEPIKPTGIMRTYPNFMTREGLRGMEYNAWSEGNPPSHTLILPFTRYLGGPGDYNPGIFHLLWDPRRSENSLSSGAPTTRVYSTRARQLALYVMLLSGLQMVTDTPEHYEDEHGFQFIEKVPVTWDETRVLSADIGRSMAIARRSGDEWFLGAAAGEEPVDLPIPMSFLGEGTYDVVAHIDGAVTYYDTHPDRVDGAVFTATAGDTLVASMVRGGGFAAHLVPDDDPSPHFRFKKTKFVPYDIILPHSSVAGDPVPVCVEYDNEGTLSATGPIELVVNGKRIERTHRATGALENSCCFDVTFPEPGDYTLSSGELIRFVHILPRSAVDDPPEDLTVTEKGADRVVLDWSPASGAVGYKLYRRDIGGSFTWFPHGTIVGDTTEYVDAEVVPGRQYDYMVRGVLERAQTTRASNIVTAVAAPRTVNVTFRVRVPAVTPANDAVYIVGNIGELGTWNPGAVPMTPAGDNVWEKTVELYENTGVQYKFTRGDWNRVEWWGEITGVRNRSMTVTYGDDGNQIVDNTSSEWEAEDFDDDDGAVRYWRDPMVKSTEAGAEWILIEFARDVVVDEGSAVVTVTNESGGAVPGSTAELSEGTLRWTPSSPLSPGDYIASVDGVRSSVSDEPVRIQVPYSFEFAVD